MDQQLDIWQKFIPKIPKENDINYAYIDHKQNKIIEVSDEEALYDAVYDQEGKIDLVAIPEHKEFILFGTTAKQLKELNRWKLKKVKQEFNVPLFITVLSLIVLFITFDDSEDFWMTSQFLRFGLIIFGILPLVQAGWEYIQLKNFRDKNLLGEFENIRFSYCLAQNQNQFSIILPVLLVIIFLAQLSHGFEGVIEAYALVKLKVREGEIWRAFSCIFLHGNLLHIFFNAVSLYLLSLLYLKLNNYLNFAILFIFSGLVGSMFSILLYPETTSVGASGGIMGLIGYLSAVALRFRDIFPRSFAKSLITAIVYIAFLGILGYDFIDNGAHLGGLIAGILIGLITSRKSLIKNINREGQTSMEHTSKKWENIPIIRIK